MDNVLQDKKTIVPKMLLAVACKQRESFLYQKKKHAKDELDGTIFFSFQILRAPTVSVMWCFVTYSDGCITS